MPIAVSIALLDKARREEDGLDERRFAAKLRAGTRRMTDAGNEGPMDTPETPHAHPKHTGSRWLDTLLALTALVISGISIAVAVHHGHTMEKLVEAQSWPFVELENSNVAEGRQAVTLALRNAGSGPARIETFSVRYQGRPVTTWPDLIRACCSTPAAADPEALLRETDGQITTGVPVGRVLLPGDRQLVLGMPRSAANESVWRRLNDERFRLQTRACYCSVFDECYVTDFDRTRKPEHVESCPKDADAWRG